MGFRYQLRNLCRRGGGDVHNGVTDTVIDRMNGGWGFMDKTEKEKHQISFQFSLFLSHSLTVYKARNTSFFGSTNVIEGMCPVCVCVYLFGC